MTKYLFLYGVLGFLISFPCFSRENNFQGFQGYDHEVGVTYDTSGFDNETQVAFFYKIERGVTTDSDSGINRSFIVPLKFRTHSDSSFRQKIEDIQDFSKRVRLRILVERASEFTNKSFSSAFCSFPYNEASLGSALLLDRLFQDYMRNVQETKLPPVPLPVPPPMPRFYEDPMMAAQETKLPPVPLPVPPPMPRFFIPFEQIDDSWYTSASAMRKSYNNWEDHTYSEVYFMVQPVEVSNYQEQPKFDRFLGEVQPSYYEDKRSAIEVEEIYDENCGSEVIKEFSSIE